MAGDEKNGYYCTICGGIPPDQIRTKRILVDGKETGIDHLEFIIDNVKALNLDDDRAIAEELLKRVREFNYVPTKKAERYAEALLTEYRHETGS